MRYFLAIIAALFVCSAPVHAQTLKALAYNTNGQVVVNTGTNVLTFTNDLRFSGGDFQFNATQIAGNGLYIDFEDGAIGGGPITLETNSFIAFQGAAAATTRTNLSLGLPALTNTSNATMMRALAGSTNTNQPYSGLISFQDFADDTHTITVSNGIITSYTAP